MNRSKPRQLAQPQRDYTLPIANRRLLQNTYKASPYVDPFRWLSEIQDRRNFNFGGQSLRSLSGSSHHTLKVARSKSPVLPSRIAFANPTKLLLCIRRKQRREVLHAKSRVGRNGRPHYNRFSNISCKG